MGIGLIFTATREKVSAQQNLGDRLREKPSMQVDG